MSETEPTESVLETAEATPGEGATEAFGLLGDDPRRVLATGGG